IYFNADIVLMDDPLSAVDAHVGKHIMDQAICGLLKDKCRILATHQLHVLHRVDRIVWMKDGEVYKVAPFKELMENDDQFADLMKTNSSSEEKKEEKNEDGEGEDDEQGREEDKKISKKKKGKKPAGALMQAEERQVASVGWDVYLQYIKASGTMLNAPLVLLVLILSQGANIMTSLWLSFWTSGKWGLSDGIYIGG
ncbi:hypothetical protein KC352_g46793, partial [Hortaea werneckii]